MYYNHNHKKTKEETKMKYRIQLKIKGFCKEDIEEFTKIVMKELYKNFVVVGESKFKENMTEPGYHKFVTLKELPKNVLSCLGDTGGEH